MPSHGTLCSAIEGVAPAAFISREMAEWSKAPVLKTGDVKASVGSNPTLSANFIPSGYVQKYPSGRRGSPAKGVGCVKSAARVQIPPSAPTKYPRRQAGVFCWHLEGFEDERQWPAPRGPGLGATCRWHVAFVSGKSLLPALL